MLPLHFVTVSICSVYANRSKNLLKLNDVTPAINAKKKHEKFAVVTYQLSILQKTQNLAILRCCFVEDGNAMYKTLKRRLNGHCSAL